MRRVSFAIFLLLFSSSVFASQIQSLAVGVSGSNGSYTSQANAIIVGDYKRFVARELDVDNYASMGVPYVVQAKRIKPGVAWIHMHIIFKDYSYYTKSVTKQGPKQTTISYTLATKSGPHPEKHDYKALHGSTIIKVISGTGANTKFSVSSTTSVTLKPSAGKFGVQSVMATVARGMIKAFAK